MALSAAFPLRMALVGAFLVLAGGLASGRGIVLPGGYLSGPDPDPNRGEWPCLNPSTSHPTVALRTDPIDVFSGEFVLDRSDVVLRDPLLPLALDFRYRSHSAYNGPYGYGWDCSYHRRLRRVENGEILLLQGDRHVLRFVPNGGGNYTSPLGIASILAADGDGSFTLLHRRGLEEHFDSDGKLARFADRHGNAVELIYDPAGPLPVYGPSDYFDGSTSGVILREERLLHIVDTVGRVVDLAYDPSGRLASLSFLGRTVSYEYGATGDLLRVVAPATPDFPAGTATSYAYSSHELVSITDASGQTWLTNVYDGFGRVVRQTLGNDACTLSYGTAASGSATTDLFDRRGFRTRYTFASSGQITKLEQFTDGIPAGEPPLYTTAYTYDAAGRLVREVLPRGNAREITYSSSGDVLEERRKRIGAPAFVPDAADIVVRLGYEPLFGFVKSVTDPLGRVVTYTFDYELGEAVRGDVRRVTFPTAAGQTPQVMLTWNARGQLAAVTDANGHVSARTWDLATGLVRQITRGAGTPDAATTEIGYDAAGNVTTLRDPEGHVTAFAYDARDRMVMVTSSAPFLHQTHYRYDANGNLLQADRQTTDADPGALPPLGTSSTSDHWQTRRFAYTQLDQLLSTTDELGRTVTLGYDANGNRTSFQDPDGRVTRRVYDERDLVVQHIDAATPPGTTELAYDANGNLLTIRDPNGNQSSFSCDEFDRPTRMTYADGSFEEVAWDAASNVTSATTPSGRVIQLTRDELGRLTTKATPDETTTYDYDAGSRLISAIDSDATLTFEYDALDRVRAATTLLVGETTSSTVEHRHDRRGLRTSLRYPDGIALDYAYDSLGRLAKIAPSGTAAPATSGSGSHAAIRAVPRPIVTFAYDALSRRTRLERLNGVVTELEYDAVGQMTELRHAGPSGELETIGYVHDSRGNVSARTDGDGTHAYGYDALSQLSSAAYPPGFPFESTTWSYDAAGNRSASVDSSETTPYATNSLNQYTLVGGASLAYDADGNLSSDGVRSHAYDAEGHLVQASGPFGVATYAYDPFGRRVARVVNGVTTRFVHDGADILVERGSGGEVRFVHGDGIDEPVTMERGSAGARSYYLADGLGSIGMLSDELGVPIETYRYDAYGSVAIADAHGASIPASAVGNRFTFTGREHEPETGLLHYRARELMPSLGRFVQRDPLGYVADLNVYRYVGNSPLTFVDPQGLSKSASPAYSVRLRDKIHMSLEIHTPEYDFAIGFGPIGWSGIFTGQGQIQIEADRSGFVLDEFEISEHMAREFIADLRKELHTAHDYNSCYYNCRSWAIDRYGALWRRWRLHSHWTCDR